MLSTSAFNALLKIMEEPPAHVIFILATTEIHKVPATILSRCQRYDFMRISPADIAGRLKYIAAEENITLTDEAAVLISRLADGAMRDALSILDTCAGVSASVDEALVRRMAGVTDEGYLFDVSDALHEKDAARALGLLSSLRERSIDMKRLTEELIGHYRNFMLADVAPQDAGLCALEEEERAAYLKKAQECPAKESICHIRRFGEALERMAKGFDQRIELELALIDLCGQVLPESAAVPTAAAAPPQARVFSAAPSQGAAAVPQAETPPAAAAPGFTAGAAAQTPAATQEPQQFESWAQALEKISEKDKALYSFLHDSKAYLKGKRVLIDAGDTFTEYIRANEYSKELIKDALLQVTGVRYGIGPYVKQSGPAEKTALDQLREMGVEVVEK